GNGYSVLQVIAAFEKAIGRELKKNILPRRAGDIAENYADPTKAREELGWTAQYTIEDMCAHTWNWQSNNPNGYKE
ncbi:MAG: GDP-mannose 4,6-dehydratase, partial [Oscillospiraceae bacterium]|nr:GDP-mannose 4,6-dehydratase [Oscillospiraceae bacterium]